MPTLKQIILAAIFVFALLATAAAQDNSSPSAQRSSLTITAAAAGDRVRITAPSSVVQMHVEVYAASGEKLFDQEIRGGNVFDWHLQDGQAQRLSPGNYICVVTAKSVSGKLTQKIGTVSVEEKSLSVQPADSQKLSALQAQTIGPVEENSSWTIAAKDEPQTGTVIAHDGIDGQMIRGRGALTFRIGDFFSGIDTEQMRLTEAGNLGIGTSEPKATLDVAGTIRAQRFLIAKPTRSAGDLKAQAPDANSVQPLVAGTGTQDRIAKWTDNAGTLGDSAITEVGGNVGIGTTTPGSKLVVSANSATLPPASGVARFADADGGQTAVFADAFSNNAIFNVRRANGTAASPSSLQANQLIGVIGASGYGASAYMGTRARVAFWASEMWTNSANGTYLTFNTTANGAAIPGGTERMRIDNAGNVGIGTSNPTARLMVSGSGIPVDAVGAARFTVFNTVAGKGFLQQVSDDGTWTLASTAAVSSSMAVLVDTTGNVGIGTNSPQSKLEVNASDLFIGKSPTGKFLGAAGFDFNSASVNQQGLLIEQAFGPNAESSGIHFDGDSIDMWSPGDNNRLLRVLDEDGMIERFAIDGGGNAIANGVLLTSSRRFKENVAPLANALDKVLRLQGVTFDWKKDRGGKSDIGFVAEDVAKVLPELVLWEKDGKDAVGLEYANLTAVTVEAIKELKAQKDQEIAGLKAANAVLQKKLASYDEKLAALEARDQAREARLTRIENSPGSGPARATSAWVRRSRAPAHLPQQAKGRSTASN